MYFGISVRSKWYWQADLVWLTLLTWLFVHMKKVFFWVICLDCTSLPFHLALLLLFSWCLGYRTACQGNKSRLRKLLRVLFFDRIGVNKCSLCFVFYQHPAIHKLHVTVFLKLKAEHCFYGFTWTLWDWKRKQRITGTCQLNLIRLNPNFFYVFPHMKLKYQQIISCKSRKDRKE